jgi:hypothetical protein
MTAIFNAMCRLQMAPNTVTVVVSRVAETVPVVLYVEDKAFGEKS